MTSQQLTTEALTLPITERISLAQMLWQSIESGRESAASDDFLREAVRRDHELTSEAVVGRTHDEVMDAARLCSSME
jgi:putative addiction module component (TIGR02574 family)